MKKLMILLTIITVMAFCGVADAEIEILAQRYIAAGISQNVDDFPVYPVHEPGATMDFSVSVHQPYANAYVQGDNLNLTGSINSFPILPVSGETTVSFQIPLFTVEDNIATDKFLFVSGLRILTAHDPEYGFTFAIIPEGNGTMGVFRVPELPVGMLIPLVLALGGGMIWLRKRK